MTNVTPVDTTYGDLKHGETILDKSGNSWVVHTPTLYGMEVAFSLADADTPSIPKHVGMTKPADAEVRVMRAPSQADEVEVREREVDEARGMVPEFEVDEHGKRVPAGEPTVEQAVETIMETLGEAEVVAEQSADEHDALAVATESAPTELPRFSEFSDLEARSHLYLVHGIYAHDVKTKKAMTALHDEHHADQGAKFVPHIHGDFDVPAASGDPR